MKPTSPATFDGFPYIVTACNPGVRHIMLLPAEIPRQELEEAARLQMEANRLQTCLVLNASQAIYFELDGTVAISTEIPRGGALVHGKLQPAIQYSPTDDLRQRLEALRLFETTNGRGYFVGSGRNGGRPATAEELTRLSGRQENGVPNGLTRCPACGDWRGQCLNTLEQFADEVVAVHCRCENWNRCARCRKPLAKRRLEANSYEADGQVWHTPGFSGLSHVCEGEVRSKPSVTEDVRRVLPPPPAPSTIEKVKPATLALRQGAKDKRKWKERILHYVMVVIMVCDLLLLSAGILYFLVAVLGGLSIGR